MKIKIVQILSFVDKALAFEWIAKHIDKSKFKISFILLNPSDSMIEEYLKENKIEFLRINYKSKRDSIKALFQIFNYLRSKKIDVVHTHLFDASLIGLVAARLQGIKKRIHTRHNSTIHHDFHPSAVKYDRLINSMSTNIISISEVTGRVLHEFEGVNKEKIELIHHGFDFQGIPISGSDRISILRKKYDIEGFYPIIGVISRYIEWKGVQYIIPAFKEILKSHPKAKLILANAQGPFLEDIEGLLQDIPAESFIEIKFESDIFALYKLFDLFVHAPINDLSEAFGQIYIEALASEVPSIFTTSGIAHDVMKHEENCLIVEYKNSNQISDAILRLLNDKVLQKKITQRGRQDVINNFSIEKMISKMENLYLLE